MNEEGTSQVGQAGQACLSCRKQKRKCDKLVPACGLCSRMGRLCDYSYNDARQVPTAEDLTSMQQKITDLEQRLNQKEQLTSSSTPPSSYITTQAATVDSSPSQRAATSQAASWMPVQSTFPSALFLDLDCFKRENPGVPKPSIDVPMEVLEMLSNTDTLERTVTDYFNTVHCWMPIVSRKRMNLGHHLREGGPDLAMLFLAMKLAASQPVNGMASAEDPVYGASKRFLALLEASGTLSILCLQAMVLVAVYELGHSIYPAAWMSVAACTRYAEVLGLLNYQDSCLVLGPCLTWTEREERRRVWWGIFVLDRAICLGNGHRFLAPEPGPNDILPMDDSAWDDGDVARALQSPVSAPFSKQQGPFARTCQASILVSRVGSHVREARCQPRTHETEAFSIEQADTLIHEISTLSSIISSELAMAASTSEPSINFNLAYSTPGPATPFAFSPTPSVSQNESSDFSVSPSSSSSHTPIPSLLTPQFLLFSAQILLFDLYCCSEDYLGGSTPVPKSQASLSMQVRAVAGMRETALRVRDAGLELLDYAVMPANLARVGPLVLDSLYTAMATLYWLWTEGGEGQVKEALEDVKRVLARLDMRWRVARDYLGMEKHHGVAAGT